MRGVSAIPVRTGREHCSPRRRGLGARARGVAMDLTPQAIEQVATRVVQLLGEREPQRAPEQMTAGELAHELRVERPWVYRHGHLLGGWRIGDGPKARWRFDRRTAVEARRRQQAEQQANGGV
jgi:hypothetical protein